MNHPRACGSGRRRPPERTTTRPAWGTRPDGGYRTAVGLARRERWTNPRYYRGAGAALQLGCRPARLRLFDKRAEHGQFNRYAAMQLKRSSISWAGAGTAGGQLVGGTAVRFASDYPARAGRLVPMGQPEYQTCLRPTRPRSQTVGKMILPLRPPGSTEVFCGSAVYDKNLITPSWWDQRLAPLKAPPESLTQHGRWGMSEVD